MSLEGMAELLDSIRGATPDEVADILAAATPDRTRALASHSDVPVSVLCWLAASADPLTAQAALGHVAMSGEMEGDPTEEINASLAFLPAIEGTVALPDLVGELPVPPGLMTDEVAPDRIQAAIEDPALPAPWREAFLARLATEEASELRLWVARHGASPRAILEVLAGDACPEVRRAARRPGMEPLLDAIEDQAREALDPATAPGRLAELARSPWSEVQRLVALHPCAGPDLLMELAGRPLREIRHEVLDHPAVPGEALASMALDEALGPRIARHPRTLVRTLAELGSSRGQNLDRRLDEALVRNPGTPPHVLGRIFARSGVARNEELRRCFACHPAAPPELLAGMARSEPLTMAKELLQNPQTPWLAVEQVLEALSRSESPEMRMAAGLDPRTGPALMWKLARDADRAVQAAVLSNPVCPQDLLVAIARAEPGSREAGAIVAGAEGCRRLDTSWWGARELPFLSSAEPAVTAIAGNTRSPLHVLELLAGESFLARVQGAWTAAFGDRGHDDFLHSLASGAILSRDWTWELLRHVRLALARNPANPPSRRGPLLDGLARSADPWLRLELVRVPELDPAWRAQILGDLARSAVPAIRLAVATSPDLDARLRDSLIEELAGLGPEKRPIAPGWTSVSNVHTVGIAQFPGTPEDVLRRLARDASSTVRAAVARHPNLPADACARLLEDGDGEVKAAILARADARKSASGHPLRGWLWREAPPAPLDSRAREARAFEVMKITDPAQLRQLAGDADPHCRAAVAANPNTPEDVLESLLEDPDRWVHLRVASNPSTPARLLETLLARDHAAGALAGHPAVPVRVLEEAARSPEARQRVVVASNPSAPPALLLLLSQDHDRDVVEAVARNPASPEEILLTLVMSQRLTRSWVLTRNPSLTPGFLETLDRLGYPRLELVRHPNAGPSLLERIAGDPETSLRQEVARHPCASPATLEGLACDPDAAVRCTVASSTNLPAGALELLARDDLESVRVQVARNHHADASLLHRLARDQSVVVRRALATHPALPAGMALDLARDTDADVRALVAAHRSLPAEELYWLAAEEKSTAGPMLAGRRDLTPAVVEILVERASVEIDKILLGNESVPPEVRALVGGRISLGESPADWEWLVRSPHAPGSALRILAADRSLRRILLADPARSPIALEAWFESPCPRVRFITLLHARFPVEKLEQAARSPSWAERLGAALNAATPEVALEHLANDAHRLVRAAARDRKKGRPR